MSEVTSACTGIRREGIYEVPGQHVHDGMICPDVFLSREMDRIRYKLELNEKDVVSCGFSETGSTWVNNIIFLVCNDVDHESLNAPSPLGILPFLENNQVGQPLKVDIIEGKSSPRLIKSHLPVRYFQRNLDKLEHGPKIVVPSRNPKDTLVSLYHFYRMNPGLGHFDGDWNEFFELFRERKLIHEDLFDYTLDWWAMRDHPNVYFVKFEDLKKDPAQEIRNIAKFLGKPLSEDQTEAVVKKTSFDTMKNSEHIPAYFKSQDDPDKNFFRKGKVGGWRDYFSKEQSDYVDELCREKYAPVGLSFDNGT